MIVLEKPLKTEVYGNIFPDYEFLNDYEDASFADFISSLIINVMIGDTIQQLGDSQHFFKFYTTGKRGDEGIAELKTFAKEFIKVSKEAIPEMSKEYQIFYNYFLDDLEKNGFFMPCHGQISLD